MVYIPLRRSKGNAKEMALPFDLSLQPEGVQSSAKRLL